jgi:hypothetical protein
VGFKQSPRTLSKMCLRFNSIPFLIFPRCRRA